MNRLGQILASPNHVIRRTLLIGGAFILGFVVLGVVSIQTWEFSNSTWFCSNGCHDVHPEEPAAYQDSYHARVKCTECHMGRVGTLEALYLKAGHVWDLPITILGLYSRPTEARSLRPPNESCERCHWPPAFHGDRVAKITNFLPDEQNSEQDIYLILKTGGGERTKGLGQGIHWHIENHVEYIALDEQKQDIRWVRAVLPDGRTVEYNDAIQPLSAEQIAAAEKRTMTCVDCHNRVGHPFPPPEQLVDDALVQGGLDLTLPFVKQEVMAVLTADYADQTTARATVTEALVTRYKTDHPEIAATHSADIQQAATMAEELVTRVVFERPGITWQSFPSDSQHEYSPGCFRCHDGKHLSTAGESIRLHCNICHSIPTTIDAGTQVLELPVTMVTEPPSHLESNFIADHRFQANESCAACHGEITFGSDDSGFCANSACHGRAWPSVELNAAFPHPIPLEGQHAGVWCYQCHEGVRKPEYKCANCHQPPSPTHFGESCGDCHTPVGWRESAGSTVGRSPQIPHPLEGRDDCLLCHDPGGQVQPAPADHAGRTNAQCTVCHRPAS